MKYDVLAVNVNTMEVYDFLKDGETKEQFLGRALEYKSENIKSYQNLYERYEDVIYRRHDTFS